MIRLSEFVLVFCLTRRNYNDKENDFFLNIAFFPVRYYCDDNTTVLFEEWFHCNDLVKDLPPVIKKYVSCFYSTKSLFRVFAILCLKQLTMLILQFSMLNEQAFRHNFHLSVFKSNVFLQCLN